MRGFFSWRGHVWLALPLRLYLGGVFFLACYFKILDPGAFALDVATYQVLPLGLVNLFALTLPWIELSAGVLLLVGYRTRAAALLISTMMVMFMVALGMALGQGLEMGCGCFASEGGEDPISWHTMVRDGVWLAMALYVLGFDSDPIGVDALLKRRSDG
ncbi:MAG: DoxX family membrane protein [Proteobacteria bacterium]|jgi:putative oxidoreductase|nr:DoxX family membrane protein [Pseudomonadota bacterium]